MRIQLTLTFLLFLVSSFAFAQPGRRRVVQVEYYNKAFFGAQTIRLKQDLRRQFPAIRLDLFDLKSVVVVGKSRQGQGTIRLRVGARTSLPQVLPGRPGLFPKNQMRTYHRVRINNPARRDRGVWQLLLNGNIKIKRVQFILQRKGFPDPGPIGGPLRWQALGEVRADKFIVRDFDFYPQTGRPIRSLRLEGTKGRVNVQRVIVQYGNGQVQSFPQLGGQIRDNQRRQVRIRGRNISKITIKASSGLIGSRGRFSVLVGR